MAARSSLPEPDKFPQPKSGERVGERVSGDCLSAIDVPPPIFASARQSIAVIRNRPDFLAANRGKRFVASSFVLLAYKRPPAHSVDPQMMRYGITVTKKIGNAVARNRMKRRFRALLMDILPQHGIAGVDHILIGRKKNDEQDFAAMKTDVTKALNHLANKV
ncbi:MAG: ribonuclease P protein component [Parasphingorhabdus sp.]|uniref:ribonuclease P protein component n=1 Tax=Parasphingorhabdus sp. TaxID=2709688 RepID=UPI003299C7E5